jgi:hypothetical protein
MPRYFFNVREQDLIVDKTGIELTGDEEARIQAEELAKLGKRLLPKISFSLVVMDEKRETIFEIPIKAENSA